LPRGTHACLEINSFRMLASRPLSSPYSDQAAIDLANDRSELSLAVSSGNVKVFFRRPA